jgi:ribose/xylose/arabinose/galactoside ABC-type transport system permease subunit
MRAVVHRLVASPQAGLLLVILVLGAALSVFAGTHVDRATGREVNNFLNASTLLQTATDASFFAIMADGATLVNGNVCIDLTDHSV